MGRMKGPGERKEKEEKHRKMWIETHRDTPERKTKRAELVVSCRFPFSSLSCPILSVEEVGRLNWREGLVLSNGLCDFVSG